MRPSVPPAPTRTPELRFPVTSNPTRPSFYKPLHDRQLNEPSRVEELTTAVFSSDGLSFKAVGARTLFKGYEVIYGDFRG